MPNRAAIVLCGGESRRMGQPKAWLPFGPERLVQRVVRVISPAVNSVVVVAAAGQPLPDLPASVAIVRDARPAEGPLRGLTTGLLALPDSVDLVFAVATDQPWAQPAWWERLAHLIADADLAIPRVGGRLHPLAAVYRRGPTLNAAQALLAAGRLRLTGLLEVLPTQVIEAHDLTSADPDLGTLRNVNTPEDYRRALVDAGFGEPSA